MHAWRCGMPSLQVRDLPDDLYAQLNYLAQKEHRSLTQETIVLLRESISSRLSNKNRRKDLLDSFGGILTKSNDAISPVDLLREDRER
jgi:plasmid stability protein